MTLLNSVRTPIFLLLLFALGCATASPSLPDHKATTTTTADPYLWLEDITGEAALEWVQNRNTIIQQSLESRPGFDALRDNLLAIFDSDERIPYVSKRGDHYYNFWRDDTNVRGVWRRTTLEEYRKAEPQWEVLLDLDKLAEEEEENWVWAGSSCLYPEYDRCILSMSRGGADAKVHREFDLHTLDFVDGGFMLPEAKGQIAWIDRDTVYAFTDFGEGSLTDSGYPRLVKLWKRGVPVDEAVTIFEGEAKDVSVRAWHDPTPGFERDFIRRAISFHDHENYLRRPDGTLVRMEVPNSARMSVFRQHLMVRLREPWEIGDRVYPEGALLATDFDAFVKGERDFAILFEPDERTSLLGWGNTMDHVLISVLQDVQNRVYTLTHSPSGWSKEPLLGAPQMGTVGIEAVDPRHSNAYFMTVTDYLTPTTLFFGEMGQEPEPLKRLPAFFDATGLRVSQHFVTSDDGTRVPYFMVAREDIPLDGSNPTLLTGYGGFEISHLPNYGAVVGHAWLNQGGVYVVANIRGGGEYGPRWHKAALKENRHRSYEDFAAVARDLIERGVTQPAQLGIRGGSNGGLLMGNMITSYPKLFGVVVCAVPLLDMQRYHLLLAGSSWMAEYGNPDIPEEWEFIRTFSPYHNVRAEAAYPPVLFTTSTRDDRVHPGHARKMMALMEAQGHKVYLYENTEGGHGGSANNRQRAYLNALTYTFLKDRLFPKVQD